MAGRTQDNRSAAVGTPLGDDVLLFAGMVGTEQLGRPFEYELDLISEQPDVEYDKIVGENVTVRYERQDGQTRYFNGYVSRFAQTSADGRLARYRATIVPWLWFLTRTADCRIFQSMKVPDIVKQVFSANGYTDVDEHLSGSYDPWDYCVQYRETDFNFVSRLLEHEGIYYFFTHDDGVHKLVLCDSPAAHEAEPGYEQVAYRAPSDNATTGYVTDWAVARQVEPQAYAVTDFDFVKPRSSLLGRSQVPRTDAAPAGEVFDYPGINLTAAAGEDRAKVRVQELAARYEVGSATTDAVGLMVGRTFELTDFPRDDQNRSYLITSAGFQITADEYDAGGKAAKGGPTYACHFTAVDAQTPYRPSRATPKPVVQGPQTAIVVGPSGQEIYTDAHGRVKVQFHWDRYGKGDETSSCWVRVSQVWAGKGWGGMFVPRVGQEVVVEFLEGDPDRPLVTGRVYNGENKPPYELPVHGTISALKSSSSPGGSGYNELRFEDKKGAEQVVIHSQGRMDVCVNSVYCERNGGDRNTRVGNDKTGDWGRWVRGDVNDHNLGDRYAETEKKLYDIVTGNVVQQYQADQTTEVTGKVVLNAKAETVVIEDALSVKTKSFVLEAAEKLHLKGGTVVIEGSDGGIHLTVGGSFINITPAGIEIFGPMVNINTPGGMATHADAAEKAPDVDVLEPTDPDPCNCGTPGSGGGGGHGEVGGGGGGKKGHKVRHLTGRDPPDWQPPKPPPKPIDPVLPPVVPCGIAKLTLTCGHHLGADRVPGPDGTFEVVPTPTEVTSTKILSEARKLGFNAKVTKGGSDSLTMTVVSGDGLPVNRKQTAVLRTPSPPSDADWVDGATRTVTIPAPANDDFWPKGAAPDLYFLYGRGCDDAVQAYTVHAHPSQAHEGSADLERFKTIFEKVNDWCKEVAHKRWHSMSLVPKLDGPVGTLAVSWGWAEEKDWRAYFGVTIKATVVLFTASISGVANLRDMGLTAALAALDIPPNVSETLLDLLNDDEILDYLGEITLKLTLAFAPRLEGSVTAKFYATGEQTVPKLPALIGEGRLSLTFTAKAGSDKWAFFSIVGEGSAPITATGALTIEDDGLYLTPSIAFGGLMFKVTVAFKAFVVEHKHDLVAWQAIDPRTLWPDPNDPLPPKWKII